jgi:general L-amino acid transport system permease protein
MSGTHAHTAAYVADSRIPPSPPPAATTGAMGWAKANLFSGPLNSILTILSILIVIAVVPGLFRWAFLDAVFVADSLSECREIAAANGVQEAFACWAVINERFSQFIYGFYPAELRWRPNLAFIGMLVALAPILFNGLPRKMMIFSAMFPFIAYWLIWGGPIWFILSVLGGFAVAGGVFWLFDKKFEWAGMALGLVASGLSAVIWWLFLAGPVSDGLASAIPIGIESVESAKLGGFLLALIIGITGIVGSLPIGILLALGRQSHLFIVKTICVMFIEFIRGVPPITLLFVASTLLNYFLPPGTAFDLILRVVIMVTLFASAYMAEVIRGGLAALPSGQYEAAASLGLDYWKSTRLIIMPQALKISIPGIVNTFIGLFKDTTLVSVIGLLDPLGIIAPMRAESAWNGIVWEFYGFVALFFFIFCFGMSRYSMYLERKLATGHR